MENNHWIIDEGNYTGIREEFPKIPEPLAKMLLLFHIFFATIDGIICDCLEISTAGHRSGRMMDHVYNLQRAQESIHEITYRKVLAAIVRKDWLIEFFQKYAPHAWDPAFEDLDTRALLCEFLKHQLPSVSKKQQWITDISKHPDPRVRIGALLVLEGVMFTSAFTVIFYTATQQMGKDLATINEWIREDEKSHAVAHVIALRHLFKDIGVLNLREIFEQGIRLEMDFYREIFADIPELAPELMEKHVLYTANGWLQLLGQESLSNDVESPFPLTDAYMNSRASQNQFETGASEYNKTPLSGDFRVIPKNSSFSRRFENGRKKHVTIPRHCAELLAIPHLLAVENKIC